jgi:hypothetical protein
MSAAPDGGEASIRRFVGVYHASGTVIGELSYWIGARLGRAHCSLCDITHGRVREKAEWRACRDQLPVPFETVHLDERWPELEAVTEGRTPCVVADTDDGLAIVLGPDELASFDGSPHALSAALAAVASGA